MVFCSTIQATDLRGQLKEAEEANDAHAQIELIRRILDQEPDTDLREQLAELWLEVGDYEMAEQVVTEWKTVPAPVRAHVLAEVLYRRDEKPEEAIAILESYLAGQPGDLKIMRQLTGYLNATGQNKKVVELLTKTPGANKETDLLVMRANAKRRLLDLDGALKDFAEAEQSDPESSAVTSDRTAFERLKISVENIQIATAAMKEHPTDLGPVISRAHWYLYAGVSAPALKDAEAAQAMAPDSVAALLLMAQAKGSLGQLSQREAREKYELDISKSPPPLEALGRLLKYDVALLQNPREAAALAGRSAELTDIQQYQRGLSDANAALEIDPNNETAHFEKIYALVKLGQRDEAGGALRVFIAAKPAKDKLAGALSALTEASFGASQFEQALDYINQAITLKPTAYYYKQRAAILARLDRGEEAQKDLAKAQQLEKGGRR